MLNVMMSNSDLFDKLYQEINRQNTFYFWYISALLVVIGLVLGFFSVLQWRLSDKQIQRMKDDALKEVKKSYIDGLDDRISKLEGRIKAHLEFSNKQEIKLMNSFNNLVSSLPGKQGADLIEQCNKLISTIDNTLSSDSLSDVEKAAGMLILKNSIRTTTKYAPLPQMVSDYIKNDKNVQKYMSYSEIVFKGWPDPENSQQG